MSRCRCIVAIVLAIASANGITRADDARFQAVYEPSGVATMPDGSVVVLDDEATAPLHRARIERHAGKPVVTEQRALRAGGLSQRWRLGKLDDLEGACVDAAGNLFAIGSHNVQAGIDDTERRKVVRLRLEAERMTDVAVRRDLREDVLRALPAIAIAMREGGKHDDDLDIEALACDRQRDRLLIGLRSPRQDDDAIIVTLTNADAWIEDRAEPMFDDTLRALDLDRGGIRAMAYDPASDGLLIVSRRDSGSGRFKAWWQDAGFTGAPVRLRLDDKGAFDNVEGATVLLEPDGILFVRDDGNRDKRDAGSWFFATRDALGLPGTPR